MEFVYSDGGRSKYFKADNVGDCVTRAICNASGKDYKEVYDALKELASKERTGKRKRNISSVRDGVYKQTFRKYLKSLGWVRHATCKIGEGVSMHLAKEELPKGILIVEISKHLTCVKDGTLYDTYDCSRKQYYDEMGQPKINDRRAVYGYWSID